jgi:8-oxo-dGTP diphosphatase
MDVRQLTKFRIAIYGVLIEDKKVLLTDTKVPSGVITNFPGGGLELGEAPLDALAREFKEETAIEVSVGELLFCSQLFQQNPEYPHEQLMHITTECGESVE